MKGIDLIEQVQQKSNFLFIQSKYGYVRTSCRKYLNKKKNFLYIDDCSKASHGSNKGKYAFKYSEDDKRLVVKNSPRFCVVPFSNFGSRPLVVRACDFRSQFSL